MSIRILLVTFAFAAAASAQSSSLYFEPQPAPQAAAPGPIPNPLRRTLPLPVVAYSYTAVTPPEPRFFAVNDLVTVIIRESTVADFESTLETNKTSDYTGEISDFPSFELAKLLQFQLEGSGNTNPPKLGITFERDFKGEGEYQTRNEIASRITARVADVKPNGTLVLEARKFIQSDGEALNLVLTGLCRAEDVDVDNTILSTKLYDLNLVKEHDGELHKGSKKGVLTKFFDFLFAF